MLAAVPTPWLVYAAFGLVAWRILHACAWRLLHAVLSQMGDMQLCMAISARHSALTAGQQRYLRRLIRSQIYYTGASLAGAWLMLGYDTPSSMVHQWTSAHELAFSLALAHWVTSFWEDANTHRSFYLFTQSNGKRVGGGTLLLAYLAHHLAAALLFAFCLTAQQAGCPSCAFGLGLGLASCVLSAVGVFSFSPALSSGSLFSWNRVRPFFSRLFKFFAHSHWLSIALVPGRDLAAL